MRITYYSYIIAIFLLTALSSCTKQERNQHDQDPTSFKAAVTRSFELATPKPIEWEIVNPDSIQPPKSYPLDIDKIHSQPFSINEFKPLKSPIKEYPLNWDNKKLIPLMFDTITVEMKKSILQKPQVTRIRNPQILGGTTSGLLHLTKSGGLPSNDIRRIIQNEDGTYWIATFDAGVSLYNGDELYTYYFRDIRDIVKDNDGKLWIGTYNGIFVLDFKKNIQTHISQGAVVLDLVCDHDNNIWIVNWRVGTFIIDSDMRTLRQITNSGYDETRKLMEDRDHNIWVSYFGPLSHQINVIRKERIDYSTIEESDHYSIAGVTAFFLDHKNNVWINVDGADSKQESLAISLQKKTVRILNKKNGSNGATGIYQEDNHGRMWIIMNDTLQVLSKDQTEIKTIVTNIPIILKFQPGCSMKDNRGVIWLGTPNKGIILADPNGPLSEHLDETNGLIDNTILSINQDSRGEIWLGSRGGISIYDPVKGEMKNLDQESLHSPKNNMRRFPIIRICKQYEEDKYFIDAGLGFSILDRSKNVITQYNEQQSINAKIYDFLLDDSGYFWMASQDGLIVLNPESNDIKKIPNKPSQITGTRTIEIINDGQGKYWIATDEGLVIINPEENSIQYLTEKEGLVDNNVMRIMLRENGSLWVATTDGLSVIDIKDQTITNYGEDQGLVPDELYEIREKEGTIYLGSVNGLIHAKPAPENNQKWTFFNYSKAQGFHANDYRRNGSCLLSNGQLWLPARSSENELTILTQDPVVDTTPCPVFITGLSIMDDNPSFESMTDLQSYFETGDSLWSRDGNQIFTENTTLKDSGYVFENKIRWDSLSMPYKLPIGLKLPHDQNYLRFSFANLCVLNRDKISFRYMLKGTDDKWTYCGNETSSQNYFNLSPGAYTFRVATKGVTGQWGDPAEFSFKIFPPWWKTWWAYLIYALLIFGGIRAIVQYRSRQLKRENRLLEEKISQRTAELKNTIDNLKNTQSQLIHAEKMASLGELTAGIAHEIQNPLNFVNNFSEVSVDLVEEMNEEIESGQTEEVKTIAVDLKQNLEKIHHHGKRASIIVQGMLEHSRTNPGDKKPTDINILADEFLRLSYHGLRAKDKSFNAEIITRFDKDLPEIIIIPQDFGRVLLNLVNNAFYAVAEKQKLQKENYKPTVQISTKQIEDSVEIRVKDNGNGIPDNILKKIFQPFFTTKPTGEGTGLGLSMSYDIITKGHGGELKVENKDGEGAEFIITLPNK